MDARSRLERQRARLRGRLQDSSAKHAVVSLDVTAGLFQDLLSASIPALGALRNLMSLQDLPRGLGRGVPS